MLKHILIYGGAAGALVGAMMFVTMPLALDDSVFDYGELIGFSTMIISMAIVFIGVRALRNQHYGGSISFLNAFLGGLYMSIVASVLYAIAWELFLHFVSPNFMDLFTQHSLEVMAKEGATVDELETKSIEMADMAGWYVNPFLRFGATMLEMFPVGLIFSLIFAGVLRKKGGERE